MCKWLLFFAALVLAPSLAWSQGGGQPNDCTRWASPTGTGDGTQGSPYKVRDFLNNHAAPGETLCLMDGEYTGTDSMLEIPSGLSGQAGNPIGVKAVNDGAVWFNGEYKEGLFKYPLYLDSGSSYWVFEGFDVGNGYRETFYVSKTGGKPHHITFRRICAFNGNVVPRDQGVGEKVPEINIHTTINEGNDMLFEDFCIFGWGRNNYFDGYNERNVLRRVWAKWEGGWDDIAGSGAPSFQFDYSRKDGPGETDLGSNTIYENFIAIYSAEKAGFTGATNGSGGWFTRAGLQLFGPNGSPSALGNLFAGHISYGYDTAQEDLRPGASSFIYNRWMPNRVTDIFVDARSQPNANAASFYCDTYTVEGSFGDPNCARAPVDRVTAWLAPGQAGIDIGSPHASRTNLRECTDLNNCPNVYTGASQNGSGVGARLCYQYENGVLQDGTGGTTAKPLWPWPMDDRIKQALQRGESNGLSGVATANYDSGTVTSEIVDRYGSIPAECIGEASEPPPDPSRVKGTYYMATNGSDALTCEDYRSVSTPAATFAEVIPCMAVGSTLELAAGTYTNNRLSSTTLAFYGGNSWDDPTTIKAATGATVTLAVTSGSTPIIELQHPIESQYIILDGLKLDANSLNVNALLIDNGVSFIRFRNGEIREAGLEGALIRETFGVEIIDSVLHDCSSTFAHISLGGNTDTILRRNLIHSGNCPGIDTKASLSNSGVQITESTIRDLGGKAIILNNDTNTLIRNNIIYGNVMGIDIQTPAVGTLVYHNTIIENDDTGIQIGASTDGVCVQNNIVFDNLDGDIVGSGLNTTNDHNVNTDPLFVNQATKDLKIGDADSPARNIGLTIATVSFDIAGRSRPDGPSSDAGAHEFDESLVPPPPIARQVAPRSMTGFFSVPR